VNSECGLASAQCSLALSRVRTTDILNIISACRTDEVQK